MSTVMKHHKEQADFPSAQPTKEQQLRNDRIAAVITLIVLAILMGIVTWFASTLGSDPAPTGIEYWPLMP